MAAQNRQLSLDANLVFDLAEGKEFAHDFRAIFQSKGYALVLPPTAAQALHFLLTHGGEKERKLARTALTNLLQEAIRHLHGKGFRFRARFSATKCNSESVRPCVIMAFRWFSKKRDCRLYSRGEIARFRRRRANALADF